MSGGFMLMGSALRSAGSLAQKKVLKPGAKYVKANPVSAAIEGGLLLAGGWQIRGGMALTRLGVKTIQTAGPQAGSLMARTGVKLRTRRGIQQIQKGGRKVVAGRRMVLLSGIEIGFDPNIPFVPLD